MARSFLEAPSFGRSIGSMDLSPAEIAGKNDISSDDFEFVFTSNKSDPDTAMETNADKIFNGGRILPVYPVFKADLVDGDLKPPEEEKLEGEIGHVAMAFEKQGQRSGLKSSSSSISSEGKELDKISGAITKYCVLKSNSTGSAALEPKRLSVRDIVFGRSRSEGDKLLLLGEKKMEKSCFSLFTSRHKSAAKEAEKKGKENRGVVKELDIVAAYRIYYGKGIAGGGKMAIGGSRRSFLPYRLELLAGWFSHSRRNHF